MLLLKKQSGTIKIIIKNTLLVGLCAILGFGSLAFMPFVKTEAYAEAVTDTLTVKVGYWGMKEKDYVEKDTYTWKKLLKNLSIHKVAYSYFRGKSKVGGKKTYSTCVVAAKGFYLEDFLNYAGVNISDIENISFYTMDYQVGAFTSFTPYQLFDEPRYYYDNLAANITDIYNDAGILTGYKIEDSAYSHKERVQTMLALESRWSDYPAGTANTSPSFVNLPTESRFRLLFGQNDPSESRTGQSAKYVHTVAITIPGSPKLADKSKLGTGKIKLSNKLGKHKITFSVASDEAMLSTVMDCLEWTSSNNTILKIRKVRMVPHPQYDDAVRVTINYEILKDGGKASINGSFGGVMKGMSFGSGTVIETSDNAQDDSKKSEDENKDKKDNENKKDEKERRGNTNVQGGKNERGGGNPGDGDGGNRGSENGGKNGESLNGNSNKDKKLSLVDSGGNGAEEQSSIKSGNSSGMYSMDLNDIFNSDKKEKLTVKNPDNSSEYMPYICTGLIGLAGLGGLTAAMQFNYQTKGSVLRFRKKYSI